MTNLVRALPVVLLAAVSACSDLADNDDFHLDRLRQARATWADEGSDDYSFVLQLGCSCAPASSLRPVRVVVANGAVTSKTYVPDAGHPTATPAPDSIFGAYDTVEELFDLIEDAVDRDAGVLQVQYNTELGFPEIVNVDYSSRVNDDQILTLVDDLDLTAN